MCGFVSSCMCVSVSFLYPHTHLLTLKTSQHVLSVCKRRVWRSQHITFVECFFCVGCWAFHILSTLQSKSYFEKSSEHRADGCGGYKHGLPEF